MATDAFKFIPAVVPTARGARKSKYATTVEAVYRYLEQHKDTQSVKIELGDVGVKSAVASFRNAIARQYPDTLRLVQRGDELYIARRD
ncbi:MAG: hypothetical protein LLG45_07230 [Actinomycetia bacterium]|nr:hypothetical protein [Actinomycetes bacterium]